MTCNDDFVILYLDSDFWACWLSELALWAFYSNKLISNCDLNTSRDRNR